MASGLGPGESAGLVLIEHVWARDLKRAFRDAGGRMLGEGFLTPETIRAVEPSSPPCRNASRGHREG